ARRIRVVGLALVEVGVVGRVEPRALAWVRSREGRGCDRRRDQADEQDQGKGRQPPPATSATPRTTGVPLGKILSHTLGSSLTAQASSGAGSRRRRRSLAEEVAGPSLRRCAGSLPLPSSSASSSL